MRRLIALAVIGLLIWVAFDLFGPAHTQLREFDPGEVGRLETAMWRSYYAKERVNLFREAAELMRSQYGMPFARSNKVAFDAARAAFVFKDGKSRAEYEKALPALVSFYKSVRDVGDIPFDVDQAAKLELEWWIVHRERKTRPPGDLAKALADLQAEVFKVPAERFTEHAQLRAEAMTIRDDKAEAGTLGEADWQRIDQLLRASWASLSKAVH
ncbi:MAG: hypothetical protein ABI882_20770 [Acidobacteriota bacterium]